MKTNEKGITLVALVVTIIVLIILAGTSINLVFGQDGIIAKAKKGAGDTKNAQIAEETELQRVAEFMNDLEGPAELPADPTKYTVRYASDNSDDGLPDSQSAEKGTPIKITDDPAERFGNIFIGWNTVPNSREATYYSGETYTFENDITLYPVFTLRLCLYNRGNECTNVTGGWTYEQVQQHGDGSKQADSLYLGWQEQSGTSDSHFKTNNNIAAGEYKIEINYKKTTASSNNDIWNTIYVNDTENRLPYKGTGTYTDTMELSLDGDEPIIIGNWSSYDYIYEVYLLAPDELEDPIKITYDANGGRGGPARNNKGKRNDAKISILRPTKVGYLFAGWSTDPNATEAMYYSGEKYPISQDITLYAVWSKKVWIYNRGNEYEERTGGLRISDYGATKNSNNIYLHYDENISYGGVYSSSNPSSRYGGYVGFYPEKTPKRRLPKAPYTVCVLSNNPNNLYVGPKKGDMKIEGNIVKFVKDEKESIPFTIENNYGTTVNIYEIYIIADDE